MRIILLGYGKMGQMIEALLAKGDHEVVATVDKIADRDQAAAVEADVAIEFTEPTEAVGNIKWCLERKLPVVVGTTGWHGQLPQVTRQVEQAKGALFHASNFSIGVNLFFEVNKLLARYMNSLPGYEVSMDETHHTQKLDHPSGTAITLANIIAEQMDRKQGWTEDPGQSKDHVLIRHHREANEPGIHEVRYSSLEDDIQLRHAAHNRRGFAQGAVAAAEWLVGKQGVFTMNDLLPSILQQHKP